MRRRRATTAPCRDPRRRDEVGDERARARARVPAPRRAPPACAQSGRRDPHIIRRLPLFTGPQVPTTVLVHCSQRPSRSLPTGGTETPRRGSEPGGRCEHCASTGAGTCGPVNNRRAAVHEEGSRRPDRADSGRALRGAGIGVVARHARPGRPAPDRSGYRTVVAFGVAFLLAKPLCCARVRASASPRSRPKRRPSAPVFSSSVPAACSQLSWPAPSSRLPLRTLVSGRCSVASPSWRLHHRSARCLPRHRLAQRPIRDAGVDRRDARRRHRRGGGAACKPHRR